MTLTKYERINGRTQREIKSLDVSAILILILTLTPSHIICPMKMKMKMKGNCSSQVLMGILKLCGTSICCVVLCSNVTCACLSSNLQTGFNLTQPWDRPTGPLPSNESQLLILLNVTPFSFIPLLPTTTLIPVLNYNVNLMMILLLHWSFWCW